MDNIQVNDEFYVTLLSDSSMNYYPENTLSSFTNKMDKYMIDSNWKVGISEIYVNNFIPNVYGEEWDKGTQIYISGMRNDMIGVGTTYIPYNSKQMLCDWKIFLIPTLIQNVRPFPGYSRKEVVRQLIWGISNFMNDDKNYTASDKNEEFPPNLTYTTICLSKPKVDIKIRTQFSYTLEGLLKTCFQQVLLKTKDANLKQHKPRVLEAYKLLINSLGLFPVGKPDMFFIYTDIIKPQNVGGKDVRCLRTINIENTFTDITKEYNNIQYCNVEKSFDSISVLLCDKYGYKINFCTSSIPTKIVLHFKKV